MKDNPMSWEEAVSWLKRQPDQRELVRACFYDDPLLSAARRYAESSEWKAVRALIPSHLGKALDVGAGRGISALALACDGWDTVALEPNHSPEVGAGAIRRLATEAGCHIDVVEQWGEQLPFADQEFDLVHCRQALHHARDLYQLCREIGRVLKPGGTFIATREHVISRREDLPAFLALHPLHRLYGGENAYILAEYVLAIGQAGIHLDDVLNPYQSDINLYPETRDSTKRRIARRLHLPEGLIPDLLLNWLGKHSNVPGRLYTFVGHKLP
jgi:SAM-dependent methyltransferase